tara:strand:+ start:24820 stop:25536 length:717 start_codon:yes stop_codon:yes gene_type:complete
MKALLTLCLLSFGFLATVHAEPRSIRVFVALCDNETQGIIPVGARIGNGNDPDNNLYWGCSDGFALYFQNSRNWKRTASEKDVTPTILRRLTFHHVAADLKITADAYRGSEMKQCLLDFEAASTSGTHDLVAFIGHNGLMDFQLPAPRANPGSPTDVIVLSCLSERYFGDRLRNAGCRTILTTRQLMYPGAFLLHDVIESWRRGGSFADHRIAAGKAYARNQGISAKAGAGIFAQLEE